MYLHRILSFLIILILNFIKYIYRLSLSNLSQLYINNLIINFCIFFFLKTKLIFLIIKSIFWKLIRLYINKIIIIYILKLINSVINLFFMTFWYRVLIINSLVIFLRFVFNFSFFIVFNGDYLIIRLLITLVFLYINFNFIKFTFRITLGLRILSILNIRIRLIIELTVLLST
jgi:hypothetical protein